MIPHRIGSTVASRHNNWPGALSIVAARLVDANVIYDLLGHHEQVQHADTVLVEECMGHSVACLGDAVRRQREQANAESEVDEGDEEWTHRDGSDIVHLNTVGMALGLGMMVTRLGGNLYRCSVPVASLRTFLHGPSSPYGWGCWKGSAMFDSVRRAVVIRHETETTSTLEITA